MRQRTLAAVVLRRRNLGEADRIITFLTLEQGKLNAVARGVRKIKSRLAGNLEPFVEIELRVVSGKNLDTVIGARPQTLWRLDQAGLDNLTAGWLLLEATDKMLPEHQPQPAIFELLLECFTALGETKSAVAIENYWLLKLLAELGYLPDLPAEGASASWLDPESGQIVSAHQPAGGIELSPAIIKLWRFIVVERPQQLLRVRGIEALSQQSLSAVREFYRYRFDYNFRTLELL